MRTNNIPSCKRKSSKYLIKPPDLPLKSTLIGSNYPCLELIFMVQKVFEPLKFDCTCTHPYVFGSFWLFYVFLQLCLLLIYVCNIKASPLAINMGNDSLPGSR